MPTDLLAGALSFLLTLAVLSYLVGDNPIYRVAIHLFVGAAAGYAVVITYYNVIYPRLLAPLLAFQFVGPGLPLVAGGLGLLLLLKPLRLVSPLGSLVIAFMVGVGVAAAIGGAVLGTIFPQTQATILSVLPGDDPNGLEKAIEAAVIILGTLATLGFFYYGGRGEAGRPGDRPTLLKPVAFVGQIFIGAAFGLMYAGALLASLALFTRSVTDLWGFASLFVGGR